MRQLLAMFLTVFLAELGDKTQLATLLFASERKVPPLLVFGASAAALVIGTALAVLVGTMGGRYVHTIPLKLIAGLGFVGIGVWTLAEYFQSARA
ncbi:MAG: TMEM165/GDT1 family protein [Rhizomicrobium sp.]